MKKIKKPRKYKRSIMIMLLIPVIIMIMAVIVIIIIIIIIITVGKKIIFNSSNMNDNNIPKKFMQ